MSSLIQWHEPMRTSNTPVKPLIRTTFPPSLLSHPYPKIIMSSFIQQHEPTRTSNTLVKPLIWTTFPPSPLSCPYLKIIGTTTLSILFPPMIPQQPQIMSIGTLWMTTCIFVSDSPLPQSSSHPNQAQRSGGKFAWHWWIRHPLSVGSIKPLLTSSQPYSL